MKVWFPQNCVRWVQRGNWPGNYNFTAFCPFSGEKMAMIEFEFVPPGEEVRISPDARWCVFCSCINVFPEEAKLKWWCNNQRGQISFAEEADDTQYRVDMEKFYREEQMFKWYIWKHDDICAAKELTTQLGFLTPLLNNLYNETCC